MIAEPAQLLLVGLAVGLLAAISGMGAGLSLPWLAWMGLPLPGALLATKLVCMVGDTGAWLGNRWASAKRRHDEPDTGPALPIVSKHLLLWIGLGGLGSLLACWLDEAGWAGLTVALLALGGLACVSSARSWIPKPGIPFPGPPDHMSQATLGLYIGVCGVGAGLLSRHRAIRRGMSPPLADRQTFALGACANAGACLALLMVLPSMSEGLNGGHCLLALSQAAGACLGSWLRGRLSAGWVTMRLCRPPRAAEP